MLWKLVACNKQGSVENKKIVFYVWLEEMCHAIAKVMCIPPQVIQDYNPTMKFKVSMNHVYVRARVDPQ